LDNHKQNIATNIARELDCGFDCFYNSKTNEIISIPSFSQFSDEEDFKEAFRDDLYKIQENQTDFIKFEALEGFESFKIMEQFIQQLPDKNFKSELETVLANKKPFQNFKHKIDNSDFRQSWFDFKQKEIENKVKNKLELKKLTHNNELS